MEGGARSDSQAEKPKPKKARVAEGAKPKPKKARVADGAKPKPKPKPSTSKAKLKPSAAGAKVAASSTLPVSPASVANAAARKNIKKAPTAGGADANGEADITDKRADDDEIYNESSDEDSIEHVDECIECGDGGKLMCCEGCPRAYHPQCVEFRGVPGGDWWCPTCLKASKAGTKYPKSRYRVDSAAVLAVERLCAAFPPSHFLSVRATQLQTVRKLMQTCSALGIETPGIRHLTNEASVIRQLKAILSGHSAAAQGKKRKKAQADGASDDEGSAAACEVGEAGASASGDASCAANSSSSNGMPPVPTLALDPTSAAPDASVLVEQFKRWGYCLLADAGFSQGQGIQLHDEVARFFNQVMYTINIKSMQDILVDTGFRTFKLRQRGRYDMVDPALAFATHTPAFSFLHTTAAWIPLVRQILGEDCKCIHVGCMLSQPGSEVQQWHSDGDHESNERHLPPHCLNVFVPLVQVTAANGGTELVPTTHIFRNYGSNVQSVTPMPGLGQALLFDYRLKHRGLGNSSANPRPILYITYATKTFASKAVAHANYSARRYKHLPPLCDLPLSREERAAKRISELSAAGGGGGGKPAAGKKSAPVKSKGEGKSKSQGPPFQRPRGRAPVGKTWCATTGKWLSTTEEESSSSSAPAPASTDVLEGLKDLV